MILNNDLAKQGKKTEGVMITDEFQKALFNIEQHFHKKEKFNVTKTKSGKDRFYKLHHVTHADLQSMTILFKVCNSIKANILNVKKHTIYKRLVNYFEEPISASEFYASLEKFKKLGLIDWTYQKDSKLYNFYLNHYINPENNKPYRFVIVHPIVFSKVFNGLKISSKKLFYVILMQQGGMNKIIKRSISKEHNDIRMGGLKQFLHKPDTALIRKSLSELTEPLKDEVNNKKYDPLFQRAELIKKTRDGKEIQRYKEAVFSIHPSYLITYQPGKTEYHDTIKPVEVYSKQRYYLQNLLEEYGLKELITINNGLDFDQMVRFLKDFGNKVMRHVVQRIKNFVEDHQRFPRHMLEFLKQETRFKQEADYLHITYTTNVYPYIAPYLKGEERHRREFDFVSFASRYSQKSIKQACEKALPRLKFLYSRDVYEVLSKNDYYISPLLSQLKGIEVVRNLAYKRKVDWYAYQRLEEYIEKQLNDQIVFDQEDEKRIINLLLEEIEKLPVVEIVPDVPEDFKLEHFLIKLKLLKTNPLL
ncbi:hypothetical protein [Oceanobacillus salinisoli]|uniref:hypothetical protein n=1 Tax=Oceanobacillus salinisoli TaxID=2678611 RepID=UPI0012E21979|nr:hypothetical protein [Oceanobacillus salinisoli]